MVIVDPAIGQQSYPWHFIPARPFRSTVAALRNRIRSPSESNHGHLQRVTGSGPREGNCLPHFGKFRRYRVALDGLNIYVNSGNTVDR